MAVHIRILGFRKMASIEKEMAKWSRILNGDASEFDFIKTSLDKSDLSSKKWELKETQLHNIYRYSLGNDEEVKIYFGHENFVEFIGVYSWNWFNFVDLKNIDSTNRWRKLFSDMARRYGIKELIYFSEWFFDPDDIRTGEMTFHELKKQLDSNTDKKRKELWGLESTEYFVERINPVADKEPS